MNNDSTDHNALNIGWIQGVLRVRCSCGADLGKSFTWDQSVQAHADHRKFEESRERLLQ